MPQHNDNCTCQFNHKDYVTADGIRNLATYEIDSHCYANGIRASEGTMWTIVWTDENIITSVYEPPFIAVTS